MSEENVPLSERQITILLYVTENEGQTENQIAKEMDERNECSRLTTRKELAYLVTMNYLEDRKAKANGFHRYYVSEKNQFNMIYLDLLGIRDIALALLRSFRVISELKNEKSSKTLDMDAKFEEPSREIVSVMLRILLYLTYRLKMSETDSQMIYQVIFNLMFIVDPAFFIRGLGGSSQMIRNRKHEIKRIRNDLSYRPTKLDITSIDSLIVKIEKFEEVILPVIKNFPETKNQI